MAKNYYNEILLINNSKLFKNELECFANVCNARLLRHRLNVAAQLLLC